jgi:hypothetical protein
VGREALADQRCASVPASAVLQTAADHHDQRFASVPGGARISATSPLKNPMSLVTPGLYIPLVLVERHKRKCSAGVFAC